MANQNGSFSGLRGPIVSCVQHVPLEVVILDQATFGCCVPEILKLLRLAEGRNVFADEVLRLSSRQRFCVGLPEAIPDVLRVLACPAVRIPGIVGPPNVAANDAAAAGSTPQHAP